MKPPASYPAISFPINQTRPKCLSASAVPFHRHRAAPPCSAQLRLSPLAATPASPSWRLQFSKLVSYSYISIPPLANRQTERWRCKERCSTARVRCCGFFPRNRGAPSSGTASTPVMVLVTIKVTSVESADDFERRLFGSLDDGPNTNPFYRKLDKLERAHGRSGIGSNMNGRGNSQIMNGLFESFDTLSDGVDDKLKKAARTFVYSDEIHNQDYSFRLDVTFRPGTTYSPKDLDLTRPGIQKTFKRAEFETTTAEVLKKADFRTKISAKAQRKIVREIKAAHAFGLMLFTTMGTKPFIFRNNMKDEDEDLKVDVHGSGMPAADVPYGDR